ncbi:MAG: leucyl/phenylalanyl-tRNA--protein transferase [Planctomycetota bacterium]|nr:leucyl/phenylalanyl-tRNA--protein transferase [Planctomycetota bacterium]
MTANDPIQIVLDGYREGAFPMADPDTGEIGFFSSDPRCILPLDDGGLKVSKTLSRVHRSGKFKLVINTAFERVITACAQDRSPENRSWISSDLAQIYLELHRRGHAHSVEAWLGDALVGGLYGVALGGAFFGESMFSRPLEGGRDASKVCLVSLVNRLRARGFLLLDCQYANPHIVSLGAIEIPAEDYLARLALAIQVPTASSFGGEK